MRLLGKNVPKLEGLAKATGKALYTADISLPGMMVGKILRSPYPHARILNIDDRKARALPGVRAVVTAADAPAVRIGRFIKDQPILAREKVRYVGEPVAAVAAVDEETALEALELIQVDYEMLPAVFDSLEAMVPGAPIVHEELESYVDSAHSTRYGNVRNHQI